MKGIRVTSEIAPLKKVLLHRPGKELLNLTPDTLGRLLFDDIPFLEVAQAEHDAFAKILRDNGAEVVYLEDLMATVIKDPVIKEKFIDQWIEEADIKNEVLKPVVKEYLLKNFKDEKELVMKTIEGIQTKELEIPSNSLMALIEAEQGEENLVVDPMPNTYFTRDPFGSVGSGACLNRMFSVTRNRETIYADYIFNYHPDFAGLVERWYNRDAKYHMEGGDILNINKEVLAIGISQRTQAEAIEVLAHNILFNPKADVKTILAINIPVSRAFMHLDTVFTQIDYDKFTVHPGILGVSLHVYEITRKGDDINVKELEGELADILTPYVGRPVKLLPCGNGDPIAAEREQWNDGSNTLCIAPGKIVVYERNDVTNAYLTEQGLDLCIMPSAELSRGRGGPRCMSMPLIRDEL